MNIPAYLQRIQYAGRVDSSLPDLRTLHFQHLLTVPLENLDIHVGRKITLNPDALFDKLITRKRGGFCYELNGLFYALLNQLGFQVNRISGRVYEAGKGFKSEFDHLAIVVHLDGIDWLVDVGFGRRFPLYPLPIVLNQVQSDPSGNYRISQYDADYLALSQQDQIGNWEIAYIFSLKPRQLDEFIPMCTYHQTSADSYFTQNKLCTLVTKQGRITLTDNTLTITANGQRSETSVANEQDFNQFLSKYFGIKIAAADFV